MPKDLSEFIITQLQAQGVRVRAYGANANILAYCFNGHDHKSASLSIRRMDGMFQCFGCGVKGRNWNAIKTYLPGVELLDEQELPSPADLITAKLQGRMRKAALTMEIPWDAAPWEGPYRHLSPYTLSAIEACRWFDGTFRCHRILFPVTVEGELQGWVARRLDEKTDSKYRNSTDFQSKTLVYPFDIVAQMRADAVALVEGPYDALRLVNMNIPALCIFGTKNYSSMKKSFLLRLGVQRVVLALDNDPAGWNVRLEIAQDLRESYFDVQHFNPPKKKDPGNMPLDAVRYLDNVVKGLV